MEKPETWVEFPFSLTVGNLLCACDVANNIPVHVASFIHGSRGQVVQIDSFILKHCK